MHHLCFEVDNIGEMLVELKAKGCADNETPLELPGRKWLCPPKKYGGVGLVELYEVL